LAIAKFKDVFRETPSHWESEDDSVVFKMARVNIPAKERDYYINKKLYTDPNVLIYMNNKNDDASKRIDYASDDKSDAVVIELDEGNYHELAYTYLNWKNNGGYKKCNKCGRLFKVAVSPKKDTRLTTDVRSNKSRLCKNCLAKYNTKYKDKDVTDDDYEPKIIQCVDCGQTVYIKSYKTTRTCRCEDCQAEHRKSYMKQLMQVIRNQK
jgi:hypothetical protein